MQRKHALIAIPVIAAALAAGCSPKSATARAAGGAPAAPVKAAPVVMKTMPVEIRTIGNVEAYSTIVVRAQIGGTIDKASFEEGDFVKQDDVLFQIDPRPYEDAMRQLEATLARDTAQMRLAEANLARDRAQEKYARAEADRYRRLAAEGVMSRERAEQADTDSDARAEAVRADQAAIESASAAMRADSASLANARVQLGYTTIRSPITGRTGNLNIKQGNLVKANDMELVTINQVQPVYVTFTVPETQLGELRRRMAASGGLAVRASPQGDRAGASEGKLTFLDNAVDTSTGTIKLKATFPNAGAKLWPGQFVDVVLRLSEIRNAVVAPARAIQTGQMGNYVFVIKADDTVDLRPVTAGIRSADEVVITQGLQPGERVVTDGHVRLASGTKVRVTS